MFDSEEQSLSFLAAAGVDLEELRHMTIMDIRHLLSVWQIAIQEPVAGVHIPVLHL